MKGWLIIFALFFFTSVAVPGTYANGETANLVAKDLTGKLSEAQVRKLTQAAEETLQKILGFWSVEPRLEAFGKIRLEFDQPRKGIYSSVFLLKSEGDRKIRIVRVYGVSGEPQMVAHKLTHAVFPNQDKLIRNMMGIPMEVRFGNPKTFPMCGYSCDEWVMALRRVKSYIPLSELGPDHEEWGMSTREGIPIVLNKARQHAAYAESGSLGAFLLSGYGVGKVKAFERQSQGKERPWEKVFGLSLKELETKWIETLDSIQKPEGNVPQLVDLLKRDPNNACTGEQEVAPRKPRKK
jgi:hypothetical protein